MILGAVRRSSGIYLTAEENPGKSQLGDRQCDQSSHQMGSLTSNDIFRIIRHVREGGERKQFTLQPRKTPENHS